MLNKIKNNPLPYLLALVFVVAEVALWGYIQLGTQISCWVRYSSVALAFVFVLYSFKKDYLWLFTACAMVMTLCADVFLVILNPIKQITAMVFFNFAQVFYALRLFTRQTGKKQRLVHLFVRVGLCAIAVVATLLVLGQTANTLAVISMIYYANLLVNIVYAFVVRDTIFAVGLIFFALCDAFVGFGVLCDMLNAPVDSLLHKIAYPSFDAVWLFYVPSQTLIALSTLKHKLTA